MIDWSVLPIDSIVLVVIGLALGLAATALGTKWPKLAGWLSKLGIDLKQQGKAGLPDDLKNLPIFNAAGQQVAVAPAASTEHRQAYDDLYGVSRFVNKKIKGSKDDSTEKVMQAVTTLSDFMNRTADE